jgi:hypothetical protein
MYTELVGLTVVLTSASYKVVNMHAHRVACTGYDEAGTRDKITSMRFVRYAN